MPDPFHFARFTEAQSPVYRDVLQELAAGAKRTHWMWFVFPQVAGLGSSPTARHFALSGLAEAKAYLDHPVLGSRLVECTGTVNALPGDRSARDIFLTPDDLKFRSSMTLFAIMAETTGSDPAPFRTALARYFDGKPDPRTIERLSRKDEDGL